ncbi:MAG: D-aminoacyl-tRNA deacylase [Planctomycetaceae bacterium]|jgi:D-tyrosyl-tRNA(Tyr) deacylase|nr:D-aminoacyl-tRNA deacylase [Planctomycetaceae bacterium]
MIAVAQRCSRGLVTVGGERVGALADRGGLVVLVGVETGDGSANARKMGEKLAKLRVFEDAAGKMNLAVGDVGGSVLVVSQFTLAGDCSGGNRPSFIAAARPEQAEPLVQEVVETIRSLGLHVETGRFRTEMKVDLVNDGPVTLILRT